MCFQYIHEWNWKMFGIFFINRNGFDFKRYWLMMSILLSSFCAAQPSGAKHDSLAAAELIFKKRCASSGESIKRTVDNVDGVLLMKLRPPHINYGDQFSLDDPYGRDYGGDAYIRSFLKSSHELPDIIDRIRNRRPSQREQIGYTFVEAVDIQDGRQYRYTAHIDQPGKTNPKYSLENHVIVLNKEPRLTSQARYGVAYKDISTAEDRKHWIAGSSLRIIDLKTNEVIAERIGYMMDQEQGNKRGGRSPWLFAAGHACPEFSGPNPAASQRGQTDRFVEKVLRPRPAVLK